MAKRAQNKPRLTPAEKDTIAAAVKKYDGDRDKFDTLAKTLMVNLQGSKDLAPYIHFIKYRVKSVEDLKYKLERKALQRKEAGRAPNITAGNLYRTVTDLAGVRILHLHTEQIGEMNRIIGGILNEYNYPIVDGPTAICWDQEYAELYEKLGIDPQTRTSMYSSVHYIIRANQQTHITAELQVRTLMEETWGEVSHRVNYPRPTKDRACVDQLKVLARMTSGCTRLVDSIFKSHTESKDE